MHIFLPPGVSLTVQRAFSNLNQEIGDVYSLDNIIGYVERWRQKPIRIENDQMPPDMTGYTISLLDCDLICKCPWLDALLERRTILHELAHLILNHIPPQPKDTKATLYATFIRRRDRYNSVAHCLYRQRIYEATTRNPQEQDAELLAILISKGIRRYEMQTPIIARMLHG